jgi:phage virion morphogenesis protein
MTPMRNGNLDRMQPVSIRVYQDLRTCQVEIKVTIDDAAIKKDLNELQGRMRDLTPAMKVIGQIVRTSVIRNFEAGGRPKWEASQRVKKKGGITLIKSHRLMNSITAKGYSDRAEIGTNVVYAAIQQLGGSITQGARSELFIRNRYVRKTKTGKKVGQFKKGTIAGRGFTFGGRTGSIPARPFLMVQDEDWTEIKSVINRYLMQGPTGTKR